MKKLIAMLALAGVMLVGCKSTKPTYTLKLKYPPGTYLLKSFLHNSNIMGPAEGEGQKLNMDMFVDFKMTCGEALPDGSKDVKLVYLNIKYDANGVLGDESYDSKLDEDKSSPLGRFFGPMIGAELAVKLDANGQLTALSGMNEIFDKIARENPGEVGRINQFKKQFGEDYIRAVFAYCANYLPSKPVHINEPFEISSAVPVPPMGALPVKLKGLRYQADKTPDGTILTVDYDGENWSVPPSQRASSGSASAPAAADGAGEPAATEPSTKPSTRSATQGAHRTMGYAKEAGRYMFNVDKGMMTRTAMGQATEVTLPMNDQPDSPMIRISSKRLAKITITEMK